MGIQKKSDESKAEGGKILLVDDEVAVRDLYQIFLEQQPFTVRTAASVNEGLRVIRESQFDLILLDIYLGDGNGLDLARRAKMLQPARIILMTGYGSEETVKQMAEAVNADGWHCKEKGLKELLHTIKKVLKIST